MQLLVIAFEINFGFLNFGLNLVEYVKYNLWCGAAFDGGSAFFRGKSLKIIDQNDIYAFVW